MFSQKVAFESLPLSGVKSSFRKLNEVLIIKDSIALDSIINNLSANKINCDFQTHFLLLCNIKSTKSLACENLFDLVLYKDSLEIIKHNIGQDKTINVQTLLLKIDVKTSFKHTSVKFINHGHGSKVWADSLCKTLK